MYTVTSQLLLEGLRSADNRTVWADYVARYRPLLVGYARRLGADSEGAEDIAQETLVEFARAYQEGKYDDAKGRLSSWLFGIATMVVRRFEQREQRRARLPLADATGQTALLASIPDGDRLAALWDEEWRRVTLGQCLAQVRCEVEPGTFEAFELFVREALPAKEVAARLGMTENAVFGAKRRVLRRVRELRPCVEEHW